ncbi:hypothetical protein MOSE0_G07184 [Monosporozyma servazzii]
MDVLDLPDLDTVIDFETAYQVLTDFDALHNTKTLTSDQDHSLNHPQTHNANFGDPHSFTHHQDQQYNMVPLNHHVDNVGSPQAMMMALPSSDQLSPILNIHTPLHNTSSATTTNINNNNNNNNNMKHEMNALPSQPIHSPMLTNDYELQLNDMSHANLPLMSNGITPNQQNFNQISTTLNTESLTNSHKPIKHTQHETTNQENLLQNHLFTHGFDDDLLSPFEANAIEKFLDNLIYNDVPNVNNINNNLSSNVVPSSKKKRMLTRIKANSKITKDLPISKPIEHIPLPSISIKKESLTPATTVSVASSTTTIASDSPENNVQKDPVIIDHEFIPQKIELPEISLDVMDYPDRLLHNTDSTQFKKWKHVEIEKMRRNQTKKTFDQLISMNNKHSKQVNHSSKRVAKYSLLNQIKEDINNIIKVNQYLQDIISKEPK